jgi:hypothetical protein
MTVRRDGSRWLLERPGEVALELRYDRTIEALDQMEAIARCAAEISGSPWRTASELAEHLRVDVKTVHRLSGPKLNGAGIPFHRIGPNGEKRFDLREVDKWVRSRNRVAG